MLNTQPQISKPIFHAVTSDEHNHHLVSLNLSIAQCKTIFSLLEQQISKVQAGLLVDVDNRLITLADKFWHHIQPNDLERAENNAAFLAIIDDFYEDLTDINQTIASEGLLHVE